MHAWVNACLKAELNTNNDILLNGRGHPRRTLFVNALMCIVHVNCFDHAKLNITS